MSKHIKTLDAHHVGNEDYTIEINLHIPEGYSIVAPSHHNRLHITFRKEMQGMPKQSHIIRENPKFPLGVPVRSDGEAADIYVDYGFEFFETARPDHIISAFIHYVIPVKVDAKDTEIVRLDEELPLAVLKQKEQEG